MAITRERPRRSNLLPDALVTALKNLGRRAAGAALAVSAGVGWVSLATWSIHDPSLNNATRGGPTNLFGHVGAGIADLTIQSLGLAAIVLFLPLAAWGWHLMTPERPGRALHRLLTWPPAVLMMAGALAALPVPGAWPLPNGFGGIMGDLTFALFHYAVAFLPAMLVSLAGFLALMGLSVPALLFACGIPLSALALLWTSEREDSSGLLAIVFGVPLHWAMRLRALLARRMHRRRLRRRTPLEADELDYETPAAVDPAGRIEPYFGEVPDEEPYDEPDDLDASEPEDSEDEEADAEEDAEAPALQISRMRGTVRAARVQEREADDYALPEVRLLKKPPASGRGTGITDAILEENARSLEGVLEDFGVKGEIINVRPGPVVTLYELEPAPGTKSSRVIGLADDIARSMSAVACRVAVVPGRNAIGIELPNERREMVFLRELLESEDFQDSEATLALALGKNIGGEPVTVDLARMPHLLIAGTTGSGKSVGINTMILSLLYRLSPDECKFIMIDPKMLELSVYDGIPHLLAPVVTDPKKAIVALKWVVREMEERYKRMSKLGVRNIEGYNARVEEAEERGEALIRTVQTGFDRATGQPVYEREEMDYEPMPYIVVIVDEMADLMMVAGKDIEGAVQRLAQMARAAGIHMITATQRPSVDVITGTIKANFPTRISFQVTSKIDSRTILGEQGAEQLLGQGDMLYMVGGGRIVRVHGPFVSDNEVEKVVRHLKRQGAPDYLDAITEEAGADDAEDQDEGEEEGDDLYTQAVQVVVRDGKASTSYVQRRLGIGYNRAATLIERMEEEGVISPANHAGKREILVEAGHR